MNSEEPSKRPAPSTSFTPAELVDELLLELETALLPRLESEYGGQDALAALRKTRAALVERLRRARWRPGPPRRAVPSQDGG